MTRQGRPSGEAPGGKEHRALVSQAFRLLVDPWLDQAYYFLDLRHAPTPGAPKGHPDHQKVLATIAFFFGLVGLAVFGREVVETCAAVQRLVTLTAKGAIAIDSAALQALVKACALMTAALLAYGGLVFSLAFGYAGFRTWAKTKGGGTTETLARAAEAAASPEIAARRALSEDQTYEATP
jgi:hypothetical protein